MSKRPCQAANPDNCRWPEHQKQHTATRNLKNAEAHYVKVCVDYNPSPEGYLDAQFNLDRARIVYDSTEDGQKALKDKLKEAIESRDELQTRELNSRQAKANLYLHNEEQETRRVNHLKEEAAKREKALIGETDAEKQSKAIRNLSAANSDYMEVSTNEYSTSEDKIEAQARVDKAQIAFDASPQGQKALKAEFERYQNGDTDAILRLTNRSVQASAYIKHEEGLKQKKVANEATKKYRRETYLTREERATLSSEKANEVAEERVKAQKETMRINAKEAEADAAYGIGTVMRDEDLHELNSRQITRKFRQSSFELGKLEEQKISQMEARDTRARQAKTVIPVKNKSIADKIQSMFRKPQK